MGQPRTRKGASFIQPSSYVARNSLQVLSLRPDCRLFDERHSILVSHAPCVLPRRKLNAGVFSVERRVFFQGKLHNALKVPRSSCFRQDESLVISAAATELFQSRLKYKDAYLTWLKKNNFPNQLVNLEATDSAGFGCIANKKMEFGDRAVKIPENLIISAGTVAKSDIGEAMEGVSDFTALALFLVYEKFVNSNSFWKPYLDMLPETVPCTVNWSGDEIRELLRGSPVTPMTQLRSQDIQSEFNILEETLFKAYPKLFPASAFTLENFVWAFTILLSRFTIIPGLNTGTALPANAPGAVVLLPFGDMVNHNPNCEAAWNYDPKEGEVQLIVDRPYNKGDEVFFSYGALNNASLMLSYGFAIRDNRHDYFELQVAVGFDSLVRQKAFILEQYGLKSVQGFPLYRDRMPDQLFAFQRLAKIKTEEELEKWGDKVMRKLGTTIDVNNEYEALQSLFETTNLTLKEYRGTAEDEMSMLTSGRLNYRQQMASILRLGEKLILGNAVNAVRTKLAPIRGLDPVPRVRDEDVFGGWAYLSKIFTGGK